LLRVLYAAGKTDTPYNLNSSKAKVVYATDKTDNSYAPKQNIEAILSKKAMDPTKKSPKDQFYIDFGKNTAPNTVGDFVYGVTRPFQPYGTNPETGKKGIFPAYLHPLAAGGVLSFINPENWKDYPSLTLGVLVGDLGMAAIVSSRGNSDESTTPVTAPAPAPAPAPTPTPNPNPTGGSGDNGP